MESEVVTVSASTDFGYNVEAVFTLKNTADQPVHSLVAFPVLEVPGFVMKEIDRDFKVEVGTMVGDKPAFRAVAYQSKVPSVVPSNSALREMMLTPPRDTENYPKNIVWEMAWESRETKLVKIRYMTENMTWLPDSSGCAQASQFTYVVTTGNLWKGKIGKADFYFDFVSPNLRAKERSVTPEATAAAASPTMRKINSYLRVAKWVDAGKVEWHFKDWAPTEEMFVRWIGWQDVPTYDESGHAIYHYNLAPSYTGDSLLYSDELLDRLLTRETKLAKEYFPERLTSVQLRRLRLWISEWLLHEIFARHGQEFDPIDHFEGTGVNRYPVHRGTLWGMAFAGYSWHGGWYKPVGQVDEANLSPTEKTNLTFLRSRIEQVRIELESSKN